MLRGLFMTTVTVLDSKPSGMNLTNVGFHLTFSLEDPTSNYSLCIHRQKKNWKTETPTSRSVFLLSNFSFASGKKCSSRASTTCQL